MRIMVFGSGASAQGVLRVLKEHGAEVSAYVTGDHGRYSPSLEAETFSASEHPDPCPLLEEKGVDMALPMSIDWNRAPWVDRFLRLGIPILAPSGAGMQIERSRHFAKELCEAHGIAFPRAFVAQNRLEAENILERNPGAYVIKNPLCSPSSPVHTILCETEEDTRAWLRAVNYEEGIFLQEYMGQFEAGHIAFVSGGELHSLVTNQEYKRAFDGNMGVIAGAPLGGIVEQDPGDKYGLAEQLLTPLLPWFREVGFHGPVQVTAMQRGGRWHVLEYNVRIGVTCGPIIMRMLREPLRVLADVANDRATHIDFDDRQKFGCSVTLAGYGYPYRQVASPRFPIRIEGELDCDVWWNEVTDEGGRLFSDGQRLADIVAIERTLERAREKVYANVVRIKCSNSYYRTDIGRSLWPPRQPRGNPV